MTAPDPALIGRYEIVIDGDCLSSSPIYDNDDPNAVEAAADEDFDSYSRKKGKTIRYRAYTGKTIRYPTLRGWPGYDALDLVVVESAAAVFEGTL